MTETYAAWWPIHDDTRTLTELIAEATPDLGDMVTDAGLLITSDVKWATDDRDAGLVLIAVAPVIVLEQDDTDDAEVTSFTNRGGRPSAHTAEDVEFILATDHGITPENVATRLGVKPNAIYRALARANRDDLRDALIRNAHEAGARLSAEAAASRRAS